MPAYGVTCSWPLAAASQAAVSPSADVLPATGGALPEFGSPSGSQAPAVGEYYLVAGVVNATQDTAALYPGMKVPQAPPAVLLHDTSAAGITPAGRPWEGWTISLESAAGATLYSQPIEFEAPPHNESEGNPEVTAALAEFVPFPADTRWIRIRHDGVMKAELAVSAASPQVQLLSPQGGALAPGQTIAWQGSDPDGDTLSFTLFYSPDDGQNWQPMLVNTPLTGVTLSTAMLHDMPKSSQGRMKIVASDGVNTGEDVSEGLFVVPGSAPTVLILSPEPDASAPEGSYVSFSASASDIEDGILTGARVQWLSNRDGVLGQGLTLDTPSLSPGHHTITVVATDFDGMSTEASVDILITAAPPRLYLPLVYR